MQRLASLAGLGAWALAAVVAFVGQALALSPRPEDARAWLVGAAVVGWGAVLLLERAEPAEVNHTPARRAREPLALARRRSIGGTAFMAVGGLYALVSAGLLILHIPEGTATWTWLFGLLATATGAALLSRGFWQIGWPNSASAWLELGLLLAIVGLALWLRLPDLAAIPPNLHGDEISIGLDARRVMSGDMPAVFAVGWYQVPALSFTIHAATMLLFGDDLFGLRLASVIEGVASIVLLYCLVRRLWGGRPALLAAAFMGSAAWHIHFSRTGFHYMQAPVATLLALYFLVRGIQDRRPLDWLLCGLAIGLSLEVYYAARIAGLLVGLYLASSAIANRPFLRTHARGMVMLGFGALVFLAPMAAVYALNPASFGERATSVLITSPANLQHELSAYHVDTLQDVLAIQAQRTLEAFNIRGESSLQYGHPAPLLDPWTGGLLAMSAVAILLRLRSPRHVLLTSWVWLTLVGGSALTNDALFSPRVLLVLPALMIGPALMIERAWRAVSRLVGRVGTYAVAVLVLAVVGLALQANVHDYFEVQVVERQPAGRFTVLSTYAQTIADRYRLYAIGRGDWSLLSEAPRFLLPGVDAVNVRDAPLSLPLVAIPPHKGVAFLVEHDTTDYDQRMTSIRNTYPRGQELIVSQRSGAPVFTSYLVKHADLLTAAPRARLV